MRILSVLLIFASFPLPFLLAEKKQSDFGEVGITKLRNDDFIGKCHWEWAQKGVIHFCYVIERISFWAHGFLNTASYHLLSLHAN